MQNLNSFSFNLIFFVFLISFISKAQISLNSSGGDIFGSEGSVSFSIGQMDYLSFNQINGSQSEGVQQTYEIYVRYKDFGDYLRIELYPNPTIDNVTLEIFDFTDEGYSYVLYGMDQKFLASDKITSQKTLIILDMYATAAYVLGILDKNNTVIRSFKILKK